MRRTFRSDVDGRIYVHFALGKAYADIGRFEASFHQFSLGNGLKRAQSDYDEADVPIGCRRQDLRTFRPWQSLRRHRAIRSLVSSIFIGQRLEARAVRLR